MDPEPSFQLLATLDTNLLFGIIGIIILLFFSAMISGSEVALFSLSQSDLDELNSKNSSKANIINELLAKPKKLLATILVANNFINIGVVILFSYSLNSVFSVFQSTLLKFIVEVILVTFLLLLFGEYRQVFVSPVRLRSGLQNV
mgnify:CR=1 FL=1